jgi:hypothetical protein
MGIAAQEALFAVILVLQYWVPGLIGGDYAAGDFRWTPVRGIALALLLGITAAASWLARSLGVRRVWLGPLLVTLSAALVAFGLMISASEVHVPPFTVLGLAVGLTLVPYFSCGRVQVALISTAAATALVDFWMACVPPY